MSAERRLSRSPVSYRKKASSCCFAASSASTKLSIHLTSGMMPRPDCFAASSLILFQRSSFFATPSVRCTTRSERKKHISFAPDSTHFWMI